VGDSITAGGNGCNEHTVDDAVADLQQADHYTVSSYNEGHSGYGTDDWAAGSVTLADAESVFKSDKVQYVAVMLGTNDTRTPAEYVMADKIAALTPAQHFANMTGIVKSLTNDGFNVVLNEPIYTTPDAAGLFPSDVDTVYSQYWALDSTLANNKNVFIGDTSGITVMGQSGNLCSDGVHPSVAGAAVLGEGWAEGIMNAVHTRGMDN
jgi:lysophospholipase L1-like esterase